MPEVVLHEVEQTMDPTLLFLRILVRTKRAMQECTTAPLPGP